jgi:hypothetical protein
MAIVVGDILSLTDQQTFLGQQILNVYFYEITAVDPDTTYEMIAQAFELEVVQAAAAVQSGSLLHTSIIVRNLTNGLDIWEEPVNDAGNDADGQPLASFYSLGYRLVRTTAATRHGSKRIGGTTETFVEGNGIAAAQLANVQAVAAAMASPLEATGTIADFTAVPVIVGRFPAGDPNAGELDLSVINPVSTAQFIRVTTQTTRRAGRGS